MYDIDEILINIKHQKKEKERLEKQIQMLDLQLQDELLELSKNSVMCDSIEEFQQKEIDSDEANQIWECMKEFYDDFMESIQEIESDGLVW